MLLLKIEFDKKKNEFRISYTNSYPIVQLNDFAFTDFNYSYPVSF